MRDMLGGFTTLTDMGSRDTYASVEYRDAINRGWVPGPRLQVAGPQLNPGHGVYPAPSIPSSFGEGSYLTGHPNWQQWENPNSPEEMTQDVRDHARYGTDLVKMYSTDDYSGSGYGKGAWRPDNTLNIYPSMTLAEARAGVVEAHRRGLTVACHAFGGEGLRDCLQSGVDIPMHILEGVTGAPGLDEETIKLFKTPLDNGKQRPACQTLWDLIGSEEARDLKDTGGKETHFTLVEKSFKRLVGAGVPEIFCSGVYALAHGTQSSQFPFFVQWGMSPADALRTATSNAAAALNYGLGSYVGYVEKGRYADIIAVPGDPLQDISVMEDVKFVMKGGAVYRNDLAPGATPIVLMKPASAHVDQFENTD
jgi:imidazolonepropionase-like amidohydrolase